LWPERLLQVALNIRGMIDDTGTAAFYQLAQLSEIHDMEDLERYDRQYRNVLSALNDSSSNLMGVAVNLSTPLGDELSSKVREARRKIGAISSTIEATPPVSTLIDQDQWRENEALFTSLTSFDFIPLARASDIGMYASRLSLALEEGSVEEASNLLEKLEGGISTFPVLWEWRKPQHFNVKLSSDGIPADLGTSDLELSLHLTRLRGFQREGKSDYLEELAMLVHAAVEDSRGSSPTISLTEFYDSLSSVSLFMDIRMKDVTFCLAELLERGWIGGVKERRGREIIQLRQPQVEHIQEGLREKLGGSEVTVEGAMGEMGLDYFTAYHVIRRLEREGELLPEEGITGIREWHWREE